MLLSIVPNAIAVYISTLTTPKHLISTSSTLSVLKIAMLILQVWPMTLTLVNANNVVLIVFPALWNMVALIVGFQVKLPQLIIP